MNSNTVLCAYIREVIVEPLEDSEFPQRWQGLTSWLCPNEPYVFICLFILSSVLKLELSTVQTRQISITEQHTSSGSLEREFINISDWPWVWNPISAQTAIIDVWCHAQQKFIEPFFILLSIESYLI